MSSTVEATLTASQSVKELEKRIGRISDPTNDVETKLEAALEIREMLENLRDSESSKALPYLAPAAIEVLRSGAPSLQKDTTEYQFRRILVEILNRLPVNDTVRSHVPAIFDCMLFILREDNEEMAVIACKTMLELVRTYRSLSEENLAEFAHIFETTVDNYPSVVADLLSEDSADVDTNKAQHGMFSFKVIAEIGLVMVIFSQVHRPTIAPAISNSVSLALRMIEHEPPAQKIARENYEAMGRHWSGMAPSIKNTQAYNECVNAQIKLISFATFVLRWVPEQFEAHGDMLVLSSLRILQDCPVHGVALRKDLMVVFRHLLSTNHRRVLINHVDKLMDEHVLLGPSLTSRELLRSTVYSTVSDAFHHLRHEFDPEQLSRMVQTYCILLQNPALATNLHVLFAKIIHSLIEPAITKDTAQGASRTLNLILRAYLDRLEALATVLERTSNLDVNALSDTDAIAIEKAKPAAGAYYATEKPEEVLQESRLIFRALLAGFRICVQGLKKCEAPLPDGSLVNRLFRCGVRCVAAHDPELRLPEIQTDISDFLSPVLYEINIHVFQEVWTENIEFFFEKAQKRIMLLNLCQMMFTREQTSPTLVAIVLKFLSERLPLLGEFDDLTAAATIRLYKLAFSAVGMFPQTIEPILASHLSKLLMDCFPLAAKASKPTHYYHLLRALFRAIGGGGGRFELLYKEVLPLLPEMLENLNYQLHASEGATRDMVVELCLTVPLRLTHLLPHLSYLMKPLSLALRGTNELVAQGLRTLELCIDNLTPDFLDPTLELVLPELMEALQSHLKPLPASHVPAHNTMRILGKLGGRNRKLLSKTPTLRNRHYSKEALFSISFGSIVQKVSLEPMMTLAISTLRKPPATERASAERVCAYAFLENSLTSVLHEGIEGKNEISLFVKAVEGVFDALHLPDVAPQAEEFLLKMGRALLESEVPKQMPKEQPRQRPREDRRPIIPPCSAILSAFFDSFPHALAQEDEPQRRKRMTLISALINHLVSLNGQNNINSDKIMLTLHHLANRFHAMCLEDSWCLKSAGCAAIQMMADTPVVGSLWISEREIDLLRILLHVLKDLPLEQPRDSSSIMNTLLVVLRMSNSGERRIVDNKDFATKLTALVGIFFPELQSSNPIVRKAAQTCIDYIVKMSGRTVTDILMPHRGRVLTAIFTKPLRALPFPIQIGMIEAVRFCVALDPPLVELNDELLRLFHEALALADAEDVQLVGRSNPRQSSLDVTRLRVACIKLLTASMPLTDFFSKQPQTRQRVTSVYFKSLYSPSHEVKDVAYEGLRMVLTHQSRLPRELLQTGLRPILMNLADPKRLSVPGLEGLARLLELLTNYFKVEIGHKLLDHFRIVADAQMLQQSARLPLSDNEGITKLVRLANIFHLLPSAANIFLENLVNSIVQTEAQLHCSRPSPFSEPLGRYLDRYYEDGVDFFMKHLNFPRHLRTFRNILQANLAPNLISELKSRATFIIDDLIRGEDSHFLHAALTLLEDLSEIDPYWIDHRPNVMDALLDVWHADYSGTVHSRPEKGGRIAQLWGIFRRVLSVSPRIDLIFEIIHVYDQDVALDLVDITHFLYDHVASSMDITFRRNILLSFQNWFVNTDAKWRVKVAFIRYVLSPVLLVHATRSSPPTFLVDEDFTNSLRCLIWHPLAESKGFPEDDDELICEVLHLTSILVTHYAELLGNAKKDIIRCATKFTSSEDIIVKQTAFLLTAQFAAAFPTLPKFILYAWQGLLRLSPSEGRAQLRQEALSVLAPSLMRLSQDDDPPQWATFARSLLVEEGHSQAIAIYQLMVKESRLFFPVRDLFIPQMANSLAKLGLSNTATPETRALSLDMLQMIFNWEEKANETKSTEANSDAASAWLTPLNLRENMVSYLVRLASLHQEPPGKSSNFFARILSLLQTMVGPNGWNDVAFGLRFFLRALEQNDISSEPALAQAISSAKVLQVISADQSDSWYTFNASILQKLIQKGLVTDESSLQDALYPIFDRLIKLYPLPKEDEERHPEVSEFHSFIYTSLGDNLRNGTSLRGSLFMLKSVVEVNAERIEAFSGPLIKLFNRLAKEHINSMPNNAGFEAGAKLVTTILEICEISMSFLSESRRTLMSALVVLVEKSKSLSLCKYMMDLARTWVMHRSDPYPTMKEKAGFLQKMSTFETRGDHLFNSYLELIFEIYTEPNLKRTDLTSRLEQSFLLGCRARDSSLRERFLELLDSSIPRSLMSRLTYILGVQSWEALAEHNWIFIAVHLLVGASDADIPISVDSFESLKGLTRPKTSSLVKPLHKLLYSDSQAAHDSWIAIFPVAWSCLSRREQGEIGHHMINLLSKDYHARQTDVRPNVIQTLLSGIQSCSPMMTLPPHLVKYLAKTFNVWHVGVELLTTSLDYMYLTKEDEPATGRDAVYDSLADIYAELAEEDVFYGLWRRRSLHQETNQALALEQNGLWQEAQNCYETAQTKARSGSIPFTESEYCLWEDHWILTAEKLQQWDLLYELGKNDGNHELVVECAWRTREWANPSEQESLGDLVSHLAEVPTPRRRIFEAFLALLKLSSNADKNTEFTKVLEDAIQLSLRKWIGLPFDLSAAHIPLLQHFQQFVELQEAVQVFGSLAQTNAQNLEKKSSELKIVLQAWRERLPNVYDDISIWSDLVAWRQNVFQAINAAYLPLIPNTSQNGGTTNNTNTFGYRGYHEMAWIINRFAHTARKHDLLDVCHTSLTRIYQLPNIEISEAFLKLREQAKCHYQKPGELQAGLEVINNTNLIFFSMPQKAEFFTLKGMFHSRFNRKDEANVAFSAAVQMDMHNPKAWAEWGKHCDRLFKENPNDLSLAANAVSCYLQAAGEYKNGKSRPLLARVLWLLGLDDQSLTISRAFDTHKGEAAYWYWIALVPQLCQSVSYREARQARYILVNLAKLYPQALFYHLRTTREELQTSRNQANAKAKAMTAQTIPSSDANPKEASLSTADGAGPTPSSGATTLPDNTVAAQSPNVNQASGANTQSRTSQDALEDVVQALKTSFPLLILSMETMVDQFITKISPKPPVEEEVYRNICLLLQDACQNFSVRMADIDEHTPLMPQSQKMFTQFLQSEGMSYYPESIQDFNSSFNSNGSINLQDYIKKLQKWRDEFEKQLDKRPKFQSLDTLSYHLVQFQYTKVDEIEVPGQYTEDRDSNQNFVRISRFGSKFENCRSNGMTWKRIVIHGNDHSKTSFAVQSPIRGHPRREEKAIQLFRSFNIPLATRKESRRRNLYFHVPTVVCFSTTLRLYQNDSSCFTLGDVFELHCEENKMSREDPLLYSGDKVKKILRDIKQNGTRSAPTKPEYLNIKREVLEEVMVKFVPDDILSKFMLRTMADSYHLWRMRKQFACQLAAQSFMTYTICLSSRIPHRFTVNRGTGEISMSEILPGHHSNQPIHVTVDPVPFRLTPNMQKFLGPIFIEGLLTSGILNIARSLTEPKYDLEQQLSLFSRDEVMFWLHTRGRAAQAEGSLRTMVAACSEGIVKRAETMSCKTEREQLSQGYTLQSPVLQTVTNLISTATDPMKLLRLGEIYVPWF